MQRAVLVTLLSLALAGPAMAQTSSQTSDWQQKLGGLLNGNQDRDNAVRQAYERGYQRGREDEARRGSGQPQNYRQPYDNNNRGSDYSR